MNQLRPNPNSNRLVDLLQLGSEYLEGKGVEDARLDAELLLGDQLKLDRVGLYLHFDRPLNNEEKNAFRERLKRRASGEPVQYILGFTEFYSIRLKVCPGVLIPRPETEAMIDRAKELAPKAGFANACDIGCGSGAIALACLEESVTNNIVAFDISPDALRTTYENALSIGFEGKRQLTRDHNGKQQTLLLVKADAFAKGFEPEGAPFDLVLSNPPYIRSNEMADLPKHVLEHEPALALESGHDGLDAHRALANLVPRCLNPKGTFLGEIGAEQGEAAIRLHQEWASTVAVRKDLAGLDRMIEARMGDQA